MSPNERPYRNQLTGSNTAQRLSTEATLEAARALVAAQSKGTLADPTHAQLVGSSIQKAQASPIYISGVTVQKVALMNAVAITFTTPRVNIPTITAEQMKKYAAVDLSISTPTTDQ